MFGSYLNNKVPSVNWITAKMVLMTLTLHFLYIVLGATAECVENQEKYVSGHDTNMDAALEFLREHDQKEAIMSNKVSVAVWNHESNLTEQNKATMLRALQKKAEFDKVEWEKATSFAWKKFKHTNETVYRWFKDISILGDAALPKNKFKEFFTILADMQDIYGKAKVCPYNAGPDRPCDLSLEPELTDILRSSRNYRELAHVWSQWRDVTGKKMKDKFIRYIKLLNEVACSNGFSDGGEFWRESYETPTFEDDVEELWQTMKPFYQQLHAYVRRKLIEAYPLGGIKPDGPIPAHLLGNMWSQTWGNIFNLVKPYPDKPFVDVTETMQEKKMTPIDMFKTAEAFFTSVGLTKMTPEFWNRSIIEKPTDREMICHASAWDFYDGKDFRIKMCTTVNMEDLITIHHEMGHIEYYLQYAHQPQVFRDGANPGFHEAVGDTIALSVATPQHLKKIGLLENLIDDDEADINSLMQKALDKIAFIPFGYLIDAWRWRVFDGSIKTNELNEKWWDFRLKYQGVCPPVKRTNDDLDAAAKYHVAASVPYIRYFVSYIVQFQFHKALCDEAGHVGPLHKCDIYKNKKAGQLMSDMLSLGSSVSWKEAMSIITKGKTHKMDAKPILEYFAPLLKWLKKQNEKEIIGWTNENPMTCPQ